MTADPREADPVPGRELSGNLSSRSLGLRSRSSRPLSACLRPGRVEAVVAAGFALVAASAPHAFALESYRCVAEEVVGFALVDEFRWTPATFEPGAEYLIVELTPDMSVAPSEPQGRATTTFQFAVFSGGTEIFRCTRRDGIVCRVPGDEFMLDVDRLRFVRVLIEGFIAYDDGRPPTMETGSCVKESE